MRHVDVRFVIEEEGRGNNRQFRPVELKRGLSNMSTAELEQLIKYCRSSDDEELGTAIIGAVIETAYDLEVE